MSGFRIVVLVKPVPDPSCYDRIEIDDWSGKRRIAEPDHPGAFEYPHPAV